MSRRRTVLCVRLSRLNKPNNWPPPPPIDPGKKKNRRRRSLSPLGSRSSTIEETPAGKKKISEESPKPSKKKSSNKPKADDLKSVDDKWAQRFARLQAMIF